MNDESQEGMAQDQQVEDVQIDQDQLEKLVNGLRAEQSFVKAVAGGGLAAVVGAALWALITVITNYQIGFMAIGVGYLAGLAVRYFGKGIDKIYGVIGAAWALVGCLLGNLAAVCIMVANHEGLGTFDVFLQLDLATSYRALAATFSLIDLLFYGIAIYEGYRFSFRQVTEDDLTQMV